MVSLDECIGMSGLSEDEIAVVAEQEHVPPVVAAEMASSLLSSPRGILKLHDIFRDRLAALAERRETQRERAISRLYAHFRARYPVPRMI
jgi:hypothetical protein